MTLGDSSLPVLRARGGEPEIADTGESTIDPRIIPLPRRICR